MFRSVAAIRIDESLLAAFERSLRAKRRSPKTIVGYTDALRRFGDFLTAEGYEGDVTAIDQAQVEAFIADQLDRHSPSTAAGRYRYLQQAFRWMVDMELIAASPMAKMSPPTIPEKPVPVFSEDELRALLKATSGKGFANRRDHAIVRLFIATGIRLAEMAGLQTDHLDVGEQMALVTGKGDRSRWVAYSDKCAIALDRYLFDRARHRDADLPWLWLGVRGRLTDSGITQVLRRAARTGGVHGVHPHRFRHDFAHRALDAGMAEGDLQALAGWRSPQMLNRYGASARAERARRAYRRLDLEGDL